MFLTTTKFSELDAEKPVEWLVEGILAKGALIYWYGLPGVGKSNLLYTLFPALETGGEWLGFKVNGKQHRILWLHLDPGQDGALNVLGAAYRGAGIKRPEHSHWGMLKDARQLERLSQEIGEFVREQGISLVGVDSFQNFGVDDNNRAAVTTTLNMLFGPALEAGAAVLVVDHTSKPSQFTPRGGNTPVGSGAKEGWARVSVLLQSKGEDLELMVKKSNLKKPRPVRVRLEYGEDENGNLETLTAHLAEPGIAFDFGNGPRPARPAKRKSSSQGQIGQGEAHRTRILRLLANTDEARTVDLTGNNRTAERILHDLLDDGEVVQTRRGFYAKRAA